MTEESKRGSNGGNARAAKLTKEERSAIAKDAAKKRWANKKNANLLEKPFTNVEQTPQESKEKHCPACLAGESLEEGEGTHILATVEHPVTLPAAFQEAEASVIIPTAPIPTKASKRQTKIMPKEFRTASSYAERRLPQAIKEKSEHVGAVAKLDAEINDLVRVIKALGGTVDPQAQHAAVLPPPQPTYSLPAPYPEYQQPPQERPVVAPVRKMAAGGAGALDMGFLANDE